ncbi:hypothetical protein SD961_10775 [Erwinia sp. MMLR14_017]|uniref:hypothetical protein n=1 Tax=Erwinia sp. MMLR14_017 TaxID=3093842 RepID=UPI00298FD634|nr:hypothetical protein [Erwinia sp. MMLR14_017]MDW8846367.1 hypothetical protein [Erwinia sp. MMLR14_017]
MKKKRKTITEAKRPIGAQSGLRLAVILTACWTALLQQAVAALPLRPEAVEQHIVSSSNPAAETSKNLAAGESVDHKGGGKHSSAADPALSADASKRRVVAARQRWPEGVREQHFTLPNRAGEFHYFIVQAKSDNVTSATIVLHGRPRDVGATLSATLAAAKGNPGAKNSVIVAPLFQVSAEQARRCHSPGLPRLQPGDAFWRCNSWPVGELDERKRLSAFAALDALMPELKQRWPKIRFITVAGFSAGGQFVQHYIPFAHPPADIAVRYVVADPGSWLYFDPRPASGCAMANEWKYGTDLLPLWLVADSSSARESYRNAKIAYLEGAEDRGEGAGSYWRILDKSCAAMQQGSSRLERGINYARYDQQVLKPVTPHKLSIIAGCRHDVRCVFASAQGGQVLFAK